ncbi:hypothetical protein ACUXV3_07575 [Roseobacteraceae bacterium NS-SX3]
MRAPASRRQLQIEFGLLLLAAPAGIAVLFPAAWMFPALFCFAVLGLVLHALAENILSAQAWTPISAAPMWCGRSERYSAARRAAPAKGR